MRGKMAAEYAIFAVKAVNGDVCRGNVFPGCGKNHIGLGKNHVLCRKNYV